MWCIDLLWELNDYRFVFSAFKYKSLKESGKVEKNLKDEYERPTDLI